MNIVEFATRRRVTIGMTTLTIVLFGLIALSGLKVNLLPDLSYPTLTVRTEYTGAAPAEIETLVTKPVKRFTDAHGHTRTKGNMDMEIAVDMLEMAPHLDHAILCEERKLRITLAPEQREAVKMALSMLLNSM